MDDADRAKVIEQQHREAALEAALSAQVKPAQHLDEVGRPVCIDCRTLIPQERLNAVPDAARCVVCKTVHEQRQQKES